MVLRTPRPTRRSDSSFHQFCAHVPCDLQSRLKGHCTVLSLPPDSSGEEPMIRASFGRVVRFSLRTHERSVAAARNSAAVGQLAALYSCVRNGAVKPEEAQGALVVPWTTQRPESPQRASQSPGAPSPSPPKEKVTLTGIFADWWGEARAVGRKPSTHESYSNTTNSFIAFLGRDDATQVTPEHVVAFKDHRLATVNPRTNRPISAKTVKDSDLSALKTLFGWAVSNRRLTSNPAEGITIKLGKRRMARPKGFTDDEAQALLKAADALRQGNEQPKTFAAKRWIPWLCAYTGARVGELAQLRKEDVRKAGNHWVIHISPEAGTVKTDQARDVVMHEHLAAKGFPEFAQGSKAGHLFLTPAKKDGDVLGPLQGLKNRLAETARETVKDPRVMPNHGWRHRFKTVARSVGMDSRVVDAIQGHAARTAGDDYGDVTVDAMALAIAKFPRQLAMDEEAKGA